MVEETESYSYVTVSHRWNDQVLKLTRDEGKPRNFGSGWIHIDELHGGKPMVSFKFSEVFKKAIEIVRHCGLEYIWIDSLCIVQDKCGEINRDWEVEAEKMGNIYAGGVL